MFGAVRSGITLSSVLGGISKGLGIINQAIPLYREIKPMIGSARKVMSVLQELKVNNNSNNTNNTTNNTTSNNKTTIDIEENKKTVTYESQSTPVFFQ